jgi:hypothetical protein
MAQSLQSDDFTPHLNKQFSFAGHAHPLRLTAIDTDDSGKSSKDHRKPFTLIFEGSRDRDKLIPEGLYAVEAEGGKKFELYLIPIHTMVLDRQDYQAAFN